MRPLIGITGDIEDGRYLYADMRYGNMVHEAGGTPFLIHPVPSASSIISEMDGLLLTGGEDIHPKYYGMEIRTPLNLSPDMRTEFESALLDEGIKRQIPVFGICHGVQMINVFFKGTLYQDILLEKAAPGDHRLGDNLHSILIDEKSELFRIIGKKKIYVTSTHHQAIRDVGQGLTAVAWAEDGIIEAVTKQDYPFLLGVQWHPEKRPDEHSQCLFRHFVDMCRK